VEVCYYDFVYIVYICNQLMKVAFKVFSTYVLEEAFSWNFFFFGCSNFNFVFGHKIMIF